MENSKHRCICGHTAENHTPLSETAKICCVICMCSQYIEEVPEHDQYMSIYAAVLNNWDVRISLYPISGHFKASTFLVKLPDGINPIEEELVGCPGVKTQ